MKRVASVAVLARLLCATSLCAISVLSSACSNNTKLSAERAKGHVEELARYAEEDVNEVRAGLPQGATVLAKFWPQAGVPEDDAAVALKALSRARDGVQDLRLAKSTFFALTNLQGVVLRSDAEQDRLAGSTLFKAFPQL
ncbi:MAG TPA: hypothetical protein VL137_08985, partial [Polyangiaceae bacterium]|nr:hypothetical protein [Polyangiaceae bacterium]